MKKHFIELINKNNQKLQKIKKENNLKNVNETINFIISMYKLRRNLE